MLENSRMYVELDQAIAAIAASYDGPEEINSLESAALPNRRAVIEAFDHLKPAIFLGFYSTRPLNRENLHYALIEHLHPAFEILVEQIQRAVSYYDARLVPGSPSRSLAWSESVVLSLFDELPALRRTLNSDVLAAYDGDPAAKSVEEVVFSYPALQALTAHRIAHVLYRAGVPMIPRILTEHAHSCTGIDIHPGARIGDRFFIDHGTGVVVGETTVIGRNVKLYQGVTLGALSIPRSKQDPTAASAKRHPTLEDDVTVYSGSTILGGDTIIGRGSVIGGNVWLTHSVPPYSKVTYDPTTSRSQEGSR